jgi:hypothetical protein
LSTRRRLAIFSSMSSCMVVISSTLSLVQEWCHRTATPRIARPWRRWAASSVRTLKRVTDDLLGDDAHRLDGHPIAPENVDAELGHIMCTLQSSCADLNLAGMAAALGVEMRTATACTQRGVRPISSQRSTVSFVLPKVEETREESSSSRAFRGGRLHTGAGRACVC